MRGAKCFRSLGSSHAVNINISIYDLIESDLFKWVFACYKKLVDLSKYFCKNLLTFFFMYI